MTSDVVERKDNRIQDNRKFEILRNWTTMIFIDEFFDPLQNVIY